MHELKGTFFVFLPTLWCMGIIYQTGLQEFLSFLNGLMDEAFWPYAQVYRGKWNATELRKAAENAYEEASLKQGDYEAIGSQLATLLNDKTLDFLMSHVTGLIYGPDLTIFKKEISEKLEFIVKRTNNAERQCKELALNA